MVDVSRLPHRVCEFWDDLLGCELAGWHCPTASCKKRNEGDDAMKENARTAEGAGPASDGTSHADGD